MQKSKIQLAIGENYTVLLEEKNNGGIHYVSAQVFQDDEKKPIISQNFNQGETELEISKKMFGHIHVRENTLQKIFDEMDQLNMN